MADKLKLARCNEAELATFAATLNDYTLLITKDTKKLYSIVEGTPFPVSVESDRIVVIEEILDILFPQLISMVDDLEVSREEFKDIVDELKRFEKAIEARVKALEENRPELIIDDSGLVDCKDNNNYYERP